jgi:hypothetical protein
MTAHQIKATEVSLVQKYESSTQPKNFSHKKGEAKASP